MKMSLAARGVFQPEAREPCDGILVPSRRRWPQEIIQQLPAPAHTATLSFSSSSSVHGFNAMPCATAGVVFIVEWTRM